MFDINSSELRRLIIHKIIPKTPKVAAYAEHSSEICSFNLNEEKALKERFHLAMTKTNKTFKLEIENIERDNSFFDLSVKLKDASNDDFILHSQTIANLLAESHYRTNIPGGYLLVMDGFDSAGNFYVAVVKAEFQNAFTFNKNSLELLQNIFLSPAKEFYKIGILLADSNSNKEFPNDSYSSYMYDDQYTLQNKDLTEYFYSNFLGFTTDKNDKLLTKKFYDLSSDFLMENVDNIDDRNGLTSALRTLLREDVTGIISVKDFSDKHIEGKIKEKFDKTVSKEFPLSFTKNLGLIDKKLRLDRVTIPLSYAIKLEGTSEKIKAHSKVIRNPSEEDADYLRTKINSGQIDQLIIIGSTPQIDI